MGMFDFLKSAPSRQASVENGSIRDLYMQHLEEASLQGVKPMAFPQFVQFLQQQEAMRKQQMQQMPQGGMLTRP